MNNTLTFVEPTPINDLLIINPTVFKDERGNFFESYNQNKLVQHGLNYNFIQDNQAFSCYGVLRGLHFQEGAYAQAKLVRVVVGEVFDIAVDIRPQSTTYLKWFGIVLSAENKKQLLIPRGFAHGYVVLSKTAEFVYKCDNLYSKQHESGIIYNDPVLQIDWQIPAQHLIISDKDKQLPKIIV